LGISLPVTINSDAVGLRQRIDTGIRLTAFAQIRSLDMLVTHVVTVHVTDQHDINLTKAWISWPSYRAAGIIEQPRTVRVFQQQGPVIATELTVMAAEGSDFYCPFCGKNRACLYPQQCNYSRKLQPPRLIPLSPHDLSPVVF
jgi:hypothetical protein